MFRAVVSGRAHKSGDRPWIRRARVVVRLYRQTFRFGRSNL